MCPRTKKYKIYLSFYSTWDIWLWVGKKRERYTYVGGGTDDDIWIGGKGGEAAEVGETAGEAIEETINEAATADSWEASNSLRPLGVVGVLALAPAAPARPAAPPPPAFWWGPDIPSPPRARLLTWPFCRPRPCCLATFWSDLCMRSFRSASKKYVAVMWLYSLRSNALQIKTNKFYDWLLHDKYLAYYLEVSILLPFKTT